jgi:NAD(P)-dependent dehydrogenase (short-subunit alcohol dehydrogenase family)
MKNGKIILVTGATDGIGYQTALELAEAGHKVLVHGRNRDKS